MKLDPCVSSVTLLMCIKGGGEGKRTRTIQVRGGELVEKARTECLLI